MRVSVRTLAIKMIIEFVNYAQDSGQTLIQIGKSV